MKPHARIIRVLRDSTVSLVHPIESYTCNYLLLDCDSPAMDKRAGGTPKHGVHDLFMSSNIRRKHK